MYFLRKKEGEVASEFIRMKIVRINPNIRQRADFLVPKVVFEDNQILVLEKPAGMVVNRAKSVKGETLQDWVEGYLGWDWESLKALKGTEGTEDFILRSGIVHRLDKETSGLLIVAKTPEAFENLQKQFKERKVKKKYLALVHSKVEPREGEIKAPVGRLPWSREKFGVIPGGRKAETKYKVISNWILVIGNKKEKYSLLGLEPETGRTHQIRVHLKYLRHPIVSDSTYAGRKTSRGDRKWCPRMFLHASGLEFFHPKTGKKIKFASKLPEDLEKAHGALKKG